MIKSLKISKITPLFRMTKLKGLEETFPPISSVTPSLSNLQTKYLSLSHKLYIRFATAVERQLVITRNKLYCRSVLWRQ